MKNCNEICEMISMYIDNCLDSDSIKEFEQHIGSCESCREELEETRRVISLCGQLDDEELPGQFKEQLHERLIAAKESEESQNKKGKLISWLMLKNKYIKIYSSVAAAVLLVIFAKGFFHGSGLMTATSNTAPSIQMQNQSQVSADKNMDGTVIAGQYKGYEEKTDSQDVKNKSLNPQQPSTSTTEGAQNKSGVLFDKDSGKGADNSANTFENNTAEGGGAADRSASNSDTTNSAPANSGAANSGTEYSKTMNAKPKAAAKSPEQPAQDDTDKQNTGVMFSIASVIEPTGKSATITLKSGSLDEAADKVKSLAASFGGEPYNNEEQSSTPAPDEKTTKLSIKVPGAGYEDFTGALKKSFGDSLVVIDPASADTGSTGEDADKAQKIPDYIIINITINIDASP